MVGGIDLEVDGAKMMRRARIRGRLSCSVDGLMGMRGIDGRTGRVRALDSMEGDRWVRYT